MSTAFDDASRASIAIIWILTEVAAVNWLLVEFLDTNLLVELLGNDTQALTAAYAIVGIAGVVALADSLGLIEIEDTLPI